MDDARNHVRREVAGEHGDVVRITLNRPEVRNAQTPQMWDYLAEIGESLPDKARFVILRGEGVDFSAGLDRGIFADTSSDGMIAALQRDPDAFIVQAQRAFQVWTQIPQIVIAAVQGNVIGAGFQLALASDLLIAEPDARFALRETSIGLVPDLGGTGALIDAIGYRRTFALCATGDFLSAEQARDAGIVDEITSDLAATIEQRLSRLREVDAGSLTDLKRLLRAVASDQDSWSKERRIQIERLQTLFGSHRP